MSRRCSSAALCSSLRSASTFRCGARHDVDGLNMEGNCARSDSAACVNRLLVLINDQSLTENDQSLTRNDQSLTKNDQSLTKNDQSLTRRMVPPA